MIIKLAISVEDVDKRHLDRINNFYKTEVLHRPSSVSYDHWNAIINRNSQGKKWLKKVVEKMAKKGK